MGKKGNNKECKKKMTKKEKKKMNHLKLMQGKKDSFNPEASFNPNENKKAA